MVESTVKSFENAKQELQVGDKKYTMFNITALNDDRVAKLPFSIRVLLEAAVRNCDNFNVKAEDVERILDW